MSENIPGPNFKFQIRTRHWPTERQWGVWEDVSPDSPHGPQVIELDGHYVLDRVGGCDEEVHQIRIVFLPEESS